MRGRAEYSFDFYDDWDEEIEGGLGRSGGLLGWGNDELDRLLAGSGSSSHGRGLTATDEQPTGRKRNMSYGTRRGGPKRKNTVDGLPDPTIIPSTNTFGFLQRLPFKIGGTLRYKPSAADLQEHPGAHRVDVEDEAEGEPLIDEDTDELEAQEEGGSQVSRTRARSSTTGSGATSDSFRSRGDLFPSDGEDDAVPLSDEFAMVLERRTASSSNLDDRGSGKTKSSKGKKPSVSRRMSRTVSGTTQSSSHSRPSLGASIGSATSVNRMKYESATHSLEASLDDLRQEEERLRKEEDAEVEKKRLAAAKLASERGLIVNGDSRVEAKNETPIIEDMPIPSTNDPALEDRESLVASPLHDESAIEIPKDLPKDTAKEPLKDPSKQLSKETLEETPKQGFVPARLPNF
jgi:hypothetical protein